MCVNQPAFGSSALVQQREKTALVALRNDAALKKQAPTRKPRRGLGRDENSTPGMHGKDSKRGSDDAAAPGSPPAHHMIVSLRFQPLLLLFLLLLFAAGVLV